MAIPIKFDTAHVDDIMHGEKTMTVRHSFDHDVAPGDALSLRDEHGDEFAHVTASAVLNTTIRGIVQMDFDGYPSYRSSQLLARELSTYYPHVDLRPESPVLAIRWRHDRLVRTFDYFDDVGEWSKQSEYRERRMTRDDSAHVTEHGRRAQLTRTTMKIGNPTDGIATSTMQSKRTRDPTDLRVDELEVGDEVRVEHSIRTRKTPVQIIEIEDVDITRGQSRNATHIITRVWADANRTSKNRGPLFELTDDGYEYYRGSTSGNMHRIKRIWIHGEGEDG